MTVYMWDGDASVRCDVMHCRDFIDDFLVRKWDDILPEVIRNDLWMFLWLS